MNTADPAGNHQHSAPIVTPTIVIANSLPMACSLVDATFYWNATAWNNLAGQCGLSCSIQMFAGPTCATNCFAANGLSTSCSICAGDQAYCSANNCLRECIADRTADACFECADAKCGAAFTSCSGLTTAPLPPPVSPSPDGPPPPPAGPSPAGPPPAPQYPEQTNLIEALPPLPPEVAILAPSTPPIPAPSTPPIPAPSAPPVSAPSARLGEIKADGTCFDGDLGFGGSLLRRQPTLATSSAPGGIGLLQDPEACWRIASWKDTAKTDSLLKAALAPQLTTVVSTSGAGHWLWLALRTRHSHKRGAARPRSEDANSAIF